MYMAAQETAGPFHWHYDDLDDKNFAVHGRNLALLLTTFFALLSFTTLCLLFRWACNRRHRTAASLSDSAMHQRVGLDPEAIKKIPVKPHRATATEEEAQCPICLSGLDEGEKVKVLPSCGHCFHPECVDAWLRTQSICPLCRASLVAGSAVVPETVV
ncbi:RING-H2 finger protein ATL66 isoform X1 [Ananas comosus]|uniref:RING-H2 finger protein ATL66 isoform X1 n=3 Tax=Ananas comosus TaxID=4615 RepID=A0A6P5H0K3_ANACO|nr:RING-H2 finger protein ATL66 isoform X1 [Ananas comosus]